MRPPLLVIRADTMGCPFAERPATSEPIVKVGGGAPPGPIEMYIRMPTRFTRVTPPAAGARSDTSPQTTAQCSPGEASFGTAIVTVSNVLEPGASRMNLEKKGAHHRS
jgi:hypothetical protein